MGKPTLIGSVAREMTLERYADLQEQSERMAAVYERERATPPSELHSSDISDGDTKSPRLTPPIFGEGSEVDACAAYGRPEYRSLANARLKHEPYVKLVNWKRKFEAEMMLKLAHRQKVKDEALDAAWESGEFYVALTPSPTPSVPAGHLPQMKERHLEEEVPS